jgi:hypothetical protein
MNNDLVKWLREYGNRNGQYECCEAADRIEKLEAALKPFADESIFAGPQHDFVTVKIKDCDKARKALEGKDV